MNLNNAPAFLSKHEYSRLISAIDSSQTDLFHSVLLKFLKALNDGLRTVTVAPNQTLFDIKLEALYNALKRLQALPNLYPIEPERFRNTAVTLFVFFRVLYKGVHEAFCNQKAIMGAFLEDPYILFKHFPYKIYEILGSQYWRIYEFHHLVTGDLTQLKLNADILPFIQAGIGDTENKPNAAPPTQIFPNPTATPASAPITPCSSGIISFTGSNCTPCAPNPTPQPAAPVAPSSSTLISFCTPCAPTNVTQNPNQATISPAPPLPPEDPIITEFRAWVQKKLDIGYFKLNEKGVFSSKFKFGTDVFVDLPSLKEFTRFYQKQLSHCQTLLLKQQGSVFKLSTPQDKIEVYRLSGLTLTLDEYNPQDIEEEI